MNELQTSNGTLEPMLAAHADEMFDVLSDPAIYEFENEPPESREWLANRYRQLEGRMSPDGQEYWLNWAIRMLSGELAGYVQATVLKSGISYIAYEINSNFWRQGIGSNAVSTMMEELCSTYAVHTHVAVLKAANFRSMALLKSLGFHRLDAEDAAQFEPESDECVMMQKLQSA